ncbi:MFS general substrate transporter [Tricholoma matsutake]|nr:MFS general substrate transporter [Tricholoma matsutake 945]
MDSDGSRIMDETATLLRGKNQNRNRKPHPLPWLQISIVLLLQICEPITSQSIYPYINQLISESDITGGDERKVGYYAGLIESLFFATEAVTVLHWSRMSDHVGRKPILLIGLFGTSVSMLCFGLSRTFWGLVLSRSLSGLLNGNIGVTKSVVGELTDATNRAQVVSLMPVVWAAGTTIGPLLGGSLANPHERFSGLFGGPFWKEYPYFLPCIATSSFVLVAFAITLAFFQETVPKCRPSNAFTVDERPPPLRKLLTFPVVISVSNYMVIAFLNIALTALMPLFFAMPVELGGLGFHPPLIGYIFGSYGIFTGLFQGLCFCKITGFLGERSVFVIGVMAYLPVFVTFPVMSFYAQRFGITFVVWILIASIIVLMAFSDMAFGCIFIFIMASAPTKRSLGAVNGLSQTTVSVARALGPALTTSMFSLSVEHNLLGGHGVYAILFLFSSFALLLAVQLPHKLWEEHDAQR